MWIKLNTKLVALSFILFSCFLSAEENTNDPYEGFNRGVYTFNDTIDGAILKPIAMGYNYVTPDVAKKGINNFYNNITDFITAVNSFLQLDFEQGLTDSGRVIVNTTIGMLGFIDVSSTNVNNYTDRNKQDFGTTLARYGWRDSAYLVLPFFGPSTFRDGTGLAVDGLFIDPIGYIDNVRLRNALYVGKIINTRAQLLDATNLMDDASIDPYAFQRDSWLQMRKAQIEGKEQIDYDQYLDYLSEDDTFDYATDDAVDTSENQNKTESERIIYLSPKGKKFNQLYAKELSKEKSVSFICGHFEGVDERVLSTRNIEEISIGDYVLSGGETAAFVVIDSILRLLPGVLGNENSKEDESFENGLLEYPQYTKPQIWEEKAVPEVLLSGDHSKIKDWRLSQSEAITRDRRPDLWQKYKKN